MCGSELNKEERFNMIRRKLEQGMKEEIKTLIEKDYSMISGEKVRERFASAGADFQVYSEKGKGTKLIAKCHI